MLYYNTIIVVILQSIVLFVVSQPMLLNNIDCIMTQFSVIYYNILYDNAVDLIIIQYVVL